MADRAGKVRVIPTPISPPPPQQGSRVGFVGRLELISLQAPQFLVSPPPGLTSFKVGCVPLSCHYLRRSNFLALYERCKAVGHAPDLTFDIMQALWKSPLPAASSLRPWKHSLEVVSALAVTDVGVA
jgi:hypothetical protein